MLLQENHKEEIAEWTLERTTTVTGRDYWKVYVRINKDNYISYQPTEAKACQRAAERLRKLADIIEQAHPME